VTEEGTRRVSNMETAGSTPGPGWQCGAPSLGRGDLGAPSLGRGDLGVGPLQGMDGNGKCALRDAACGMRHGHGKCEVHGVYTSLQAAQHVQVQTK
jgi:hypothetical protein